MSSINMLLSLQVYPINRFHQNTKINFKILIGCNVVVNCGSAAANPAVAGRTSTPSSSGGVCQESGIIRPNRPCCLLDGNQEHAAHALGKADEITDPTTQLRTYCQVTI